MVRGIDKFRECFRDFSDHYIIIGATLAPADTYDLPEQIKSDLQAFAEKVNNNLPGKEIFTKMGLQGLKADQVLKQLINSFNLND